MIQVISDGRLGNQMFQYAFAIATAKKLNTKFHIEFIHHKDEVIDFFDLPETLNQLRAGKLDRWIFNRRAGLHLNRYFEDDFEQYYEPKDNHCIYKGYFQNEKYFTDEVQLIKSIFRVKQQWKHEFEKIKDKYDFENSIVIHIRLRDYITWGSPELGGTDLSLPGSYYENALKVLGEHRDVPVIVVSDDLELAFQRLSFLKNKVSLNFSSHILFQAILHAKRLIISNSTFAWWAAWLNPHLPQVIAPMNWLGFKVGKEHPHGIMSASFIPVPVF